MYLCFFFKQKTAYEMRISDWSSDVCSSDLGAGGWGRRIGQAPTYPIRRKPMSSSRRTTTITRKGAGMTQGKTVTIVLVALIVGLGAGFVLRPIILPAGQAAAGVSAPIPAMTEPRGTQYFRAQLDEDRKSGG